MPAQGVDPNPPKAPRSKSPKEAAEEEGDEVEDVDNGSQPIKTEYWDRAGGGGHISYECLSPFWGILAPHKSKIP